MSVAVELDIRHLTPTIGAEVIGLDCSVPFDTATVDAVRAAWLEHLVLFFPDQDLTPQQHAAFAAQFGELTTGHPIEPVLAEQREVLPIDSVKDRTNFWHTDVTYMATPPTGAALYAVSLPSVGGDTMWANTRAAYEALAAPLQEFCDGLVAYHYDQFYAQRIASGEGNDWDGEPVTQLWPVEHPVVRVHPETGAKNLFVNPQFTVGLKGFDGIQGPGLLRMLYEHMTQPQFVVRYRWRPGTLGFWDNRTTMHYGIYDYGTERRVMHRVTLQGKPPVGVMHADRRDDEGGEVPCFAHLLEPDGTLDTPPESPPTDDEAPAPDRIDDAPGQP